MDRQRRILRWNRAAQDITGFSAGEVVGRRCMHDILRHVSEDGVPLCHSLCPLVHAMAQGTAQRDVIYLRKKDGERARVEIFAYPVRQSDGRIVGAIETFSELASERTEP